MYRDIEKMIKEQGKEPFYDYYRSLGYDPKVSAVLTLFIYGNNKYEKMKIEEIYEALRKGTVHKLPLEGAAYADFWKAPSFLTSPSSPPSTRHSTPPSRSDSAKKKSSEYLLKAIFSPEKEETERSSSKGPKASKASKGLKKSAEERERPLESPSFRRSEKASKTGPEAPSLLTSPKINAPLPSASSSSAPPAFLNKNLNTGISGTGSADPFSRSAVQEKGALHRKEFFSTDEYAPIEENAARSTTVEPTSTFRMTTNTASAGVVLNQLRNERRIDSSMVRIEEMLNYFRYQTVKPSEEDFRISFEKMSAEGNRKYLYINVQGREVSRKRQNIVVLLDVSGSMTINAVQTQAIYATIISKLEKGDRISLVTYSSTDAVVINALEIREESDRIKAIEELLCLEINGWTCGSAGIEKAYRIGRENYIENGNNQVILITDGDLNFGITDKGGLTELITEKKKENLFLSVIGTGLFNYKDDKLETISKNGNGVYRTVNSLSDVKKSINQEYSSLVNIIAKDVKAQVEFNPEVVDSYRLLGFENRTLSHEDFKDDTVISEPYGSGGYGVALYELTMREGESPVDNGLKYSKIVTTGSKELGTVKVRYKEPLKEVSREIEKVIEDASDDFTDNLRLAFIVYVCAEKLRDSDKITEQEIALAKQLYEELGDAVREMNAADLYKLGGLLEKSKDELGIGIHKPEPFPW